MTEPISFAPVDKLGYEFNLYRSLSISGQDYWMVEIKGRRRTKDGRLGKSQLFLRLVEPVDNMRATDLLRCAADLLDQGVVEWGRQEGIIDV